MEFGTTTDFLTHVVVVVTCPAADGGRAFYLLDPTFNMHFSDQDSGAPITVEALLNREKGGSIPSGFTWAAWRSAPLSSIPAEPSSSASAVAPPRVP